MVSNKMKHFYLVKQWNEMWRTIHGFCRV